MLDWRKVMLIIIYGTLCGVMEIVLLEVLLIFQSVKNFIKKHCDYWIIRAPKNNVFYNITKNGEISLSPFHPNTISFGRTVGCVFIVPLVAKFLSPKLAICLYIFFSAADYVDGEVARKCNLKTELGKKFDPLCDKICYLSPMVLAGLSVIVSFCTLSKWVWFLLLSEVWGQFVIRPILPRLGLEKNVAANRIGKFKAVLCFTLIPYSFLVNIGAPIPNRKEEALITCFILSMLSWGFKLIKERWYANLLTALNLLCGIAAFYFAGRNNTYVMLLILAGQIFDAADGYIANKYGGTPPWGEVFDDIADLISFGVVPAKMIILFLSKTNLSYFLGGIYFFAISFRLIRFLLVDKKIPTEKTLNWLEKFSLFSRKKMKKIKLLRKFSFLFFDKKGRERSNNIFAGLPSPAAATVVLGAILLFPEWLLEIVTVVVIGLTISRIHFAHFSREILPQMPKLMKTALVIVLFTVVVCTLISGQHFTIALSSIISGGIYLLYNLCKYNYI